MVLTNWLTWCKCRGRSGHIRLKFSKGTGPASEGATDVGESSSSYIPELDSSDDDDVEESNASLHLQA